MIINIIKCRNLLTVKRIFSSFDIDILSSGDFLLKNQMSITPTNTHRSIRMISPTHDRSTPSMVNEKSLRAHLLDVKYDNYNKPRMNVDTITLVLQRDKRILDFGFSISDRLYGTGVYVNKIRPNGPAELEGTLIPCMRIYKVRSF